ncbi:hypothetical protein BOX15_Mlig011224g2 [Macrostomum lignano]|uniref:DUF4097 domain-containing protein n=2 Tax=Macrostomum lignano TaxID=282301 RepID=A0A1I8GK93_9PLAT|nr:hypothetical protein BOX15_Mlig011224g2 [Macrostomum lignano]
MRAMLNKYRCVPRGLLTQYCRILSTGIQPNGQIELRTGLFGRLNIASSNRPVEIASLDPNMHHDIDRVLVSRADSDEEAKIKANGGESVGAAFAVAKQTGEREWLIESVSATDCVTNHEQKSMNLAPLRAMIPIPMDLGVTAGCVGCSISVIENRKIDLVAKSSSLTIEFSLNRVKSEEVNVSADEGSTLLKFNKTVLHTLNARARDSLSLQSAAMYQGSELNLECNNGLVAMQANALYCRNCNLQGGQVSVRCGSAHGNFRVSSDGAEASSLDVDSLEGSLEARLLYGDVRLHLTRPNQIELDIGEGCIDLSLQPPNIEDSSKNVNTNHRHSLLLDVTAPEIDLEGSELAHLSDSRFPLGPHAVRLVVELPCLAPLNSSGGDAGSSTCSVKLRSGRVKISQHAASGLFAWLSSGTV